MGAAVGPGELRSNDPHDGGSDHKLTATIDPAGFRRLINVVDDWATGLYSITAHNCAGFAKAAWTAATAIPGDSIDGLGIHFWTPLGLAQDIDWTKESAAKSRAGGAPPPQ